MRQVSTRPIDDHLDSEIFVCPGMLASVGINSLSDQLRLKIHCGQRPRQKGLGRKG